MRDMAANPAQGLGAAYRLWTDLLDSGTEPTDDEPAEVLAGHADAAGGISIRISKSG